MGCRTFDLSLLIIMRPLFFFIVQYLVIVCGSLSVLCYTGMCQRRNRFAGTRPLPPTQLQSIVNTEFVRTRYVFAQDEHGRTPLSLGVLLNDLSLGKKRNCNKKEYLHKVVFL